MPIPDQGGVAARDARLLIPALGPFYAAAAPIASALLRVAFGLTIVPVAGNVRRFFAKQSKAETFALSVKNFVLQGLALCLLLLARVFIQ